MLASPAVAVAKRHWKGYARPDGGLEKLRLAGQIVLPIAAFVAALLTKPTVDSTAVGLILGAAAILTGLLFQLLLTVLTMVQRLEDQLAVPGVASRASTRVLFKYLRQLDADISYTVAVGVVLVAGLTAALFVETESANFRTIGTAVVAAVIAHFSFSLFKVLSRYRAASSRTFKDVALALGVEPD